MFPDWRRLWRKDSSRFSRPARKRIARRHVHSARLERLENRCLPSGGSLSQALIAKPGQYTAAENGRLIVPAKDGVLPSPAPGEIVRPLSAPAHGEFLLNTNGSFFYQPASGFQGQDSFTYEAVVSLDVSAPLSATITVVPLFRYPARYSAGPEVPDTLAAADFNGDGKVDLITSNHSNGTVSVLLGNGNGTFRKAVDYPAGSYPVDVAVADVNGDGKPDLIVADVGLGSNGYADAGVSLLLGNGDGTFQQAQPLDAGLLGVSSVAVADVNGDGKPDLVVGGSGGVSLLLGNGDGTFQPPRLLDAGLLGVSSVAVADVNGDGKPDAVVGGGSGGVSLLLGNGDGTFQPPRLLDAGLFDVSSVAVADVNGDGKPNAVVVAGYGGVSVLLGNGNGTFQRPRLLDTGYFAVTSLAVADVNGDGKPDVLFCYGYPAGIVRRAGVSVLLGNGNGSFQQPRLLNIAGVGTVFGPAGADVNLVVADVNSDGRPDLVVADEAGVSFFEGNGDGSFQNQSQGAAPGTYPVALAVGDVNGDGRPDLIVGGDVGVSLLLGNGDGSFQEPQALDAGLLSVSSVAVADVNGDGKPDLVVGAVGLRGYGEASVLLGNGNGTFQRPRLLDTGLFRVSSVAVADVNGDGKPDLVVGGYGRVSLLLSNSDGTFQPPRLFDAGLAVSSVAVADVNGDGKPDLVVGGFGGVSVLLGNGDGSFAPPLTFLEGVGVKSVVPVELTGDGPPDLVLAGQGSSYANQLYVVNGVSVLLNNGNGSFQGPILFETGPSPTGLVAADFNGDGKADVAVADETANTVTVLLQGAPNGTPPPFLPTPPIIAGAALATTLGNVQVVVISTSPQAASVIFNFQTTAAQAATVLPAFQGSVGFGSNPATPQGGPGLEGPAFLGSLGSGERVLAEREAMLPPSGNPFSGPDLATRLLLGLKPTLSLGANSGLAPVPRLRPGELPEDQFYDTSPESERFPDPSPSMIGLEKAPPPHVPKAPGQPQSKSDDGLHRTTAAVLDEILDFDLPGAVRPPTELEKALAEGLWPGGRPPHRGRYPPAGGSEPTGTAVTVPGGDTRAVRLDPRVASEILMLIALAAGTWPANRTDNDPDAQFRELRHPTAE
jgi:hypothetical protein